MYFLKFYNYIVQSFIRFLTPKILQVCDKVRLSCKTSRSLWSSHFVPQDNLIDKVLHIVPSKEKRSLTVTLTYCWWSCDLVALLWKLFVSKVDWLWTFGSYRKQSAIFRCDNIFTSIGYYCLNSSRQIFQQGIAYCT